MKPGAGPTKFASTQWSMVLAAGCLASPGSREALAHLFETYWYPLYAFARRQGSSEDAASDSIQDFFTYLMERDGLRHARRDKGRFRSYLLGAFRHYLSHERQRQAALKRGGGHTHLSLDQAFFDPHDAERRYLTEPADQLTPERVYERRWALTLLDRGLSRLRREYTNLGKGELFDALKGFLIGEEARGAIGEVAAGLGMSPGAVRVAVHRLRRRFRELLRTEIAATVEKPEEVDAEMRDLLAALGR